MDIDVMLRELPCRTIVKVIPKYEHLDFLWARDVNEKVFHHVFAALESHNRGHSTVSAKQAIPPSRDLEKEDPTKSARSLRPPVRQVPNISTSRKHHSPSDRLSPQGLPYTDENWKIDPGKVPEDVDIDAINYY